MTLNGDTLARIALAAGALIMQVYATDFTVERKDDASPVTEADEKAEALILEALNVADPDLPVIAEEAVAAGNIPEHGARFALVDPLDGTKEFINKRGEFTVNIGIIENGVPVMGVVYAPALNRLFVAESRFSAWQAEAEPGGAVPAASARTPLRIRRAPEAGLTAIASKSHRSDETNAFLDSQPIADVRAGKPTSRRDYGAARSVGLYRHPCRPPERLRLRARKRRTPGSPFGLCAGGLGRDACGCGRLVAGQTLLRSVG